ncbi:MAG: hypothetical protein RR365_05120 [Bacteroides sp.]
MKRILILFISVFIAVVSLQAQSEGTDWQASVEHVKGLIQKNPAQAITETEQLLKGKNKKNAELLTAIAHVYLDAGKVPEAEVYLTLAKKVNPRLAIVSVLEGDIDIAKKEAGAACQLYEQAIYFDPSCEEAYLKFAEVYKGASPQLAIEKLVQLKKRNPSCTLADKKLAEIYYLNNRFDEAGEAYARFINLSGATEEELMKYAFALFMNHQFDQSLEIVNKGLQRNNHHAGFCRLAMYNYTDLKRYDEARKAAEAFFHTSDKAAFSYLDYAYYGHLLSAMKNDDEAVAEYKKALALDASKIDLWRDLSNADENAGRYAEAINAYQHYYTSLLTEQQTPDLLFPLGKLYYEQGTQSDSLLITAADRKVALASADSIFEQIARAVPDSYLGNFWRARTCSALDPETVQGLAKPYYETVAALLAHKNDPRYNAAVIECYSYLGYYYLLAGKLPQSKEFWNKILAIDPANATAQRALSGIK